MARDPVRLLRTVRLHAVEQARHALAACLARELAAAQRLRAIDDAASRDRAANPAVAEAHRFLDTFARRLQVSAEERGTVAADLAAAQADSDAARALLVEARTAAEVLATLIAERAAAVELDARRREQHALDDMARTRFDSPGR
jgi:hypothetical protein